MVDLWTSGDADFKRRSCRSSTDFHLSSFRHKRSRLSVHVTWLLSETVLRLMSNYIPSNLQHTQYSWYCSRQLLTNYFYMRLSNSFTTFYQSLAASRRHDICLYDNENLVSVKPLICYWIQKAEGGFLRCSRQTIVAWLDVVTTVC